jgi:hypothetical protein
MKKTILALATLALIAACDKTETEAPADESTEATPSVQAAEKTDEAAEAPAEKTEEAAEKTAKKFPDDLKPGEEGFYGAKFTVIEPPITLAKALEQAPEFDGAVKVEATVKAVCKKKGCWFTMTDDSTEEVVRVRMKDYGFFVPKNAEGARVVAEGALTSKEISQEEAQHYADDAAEAGEEAKKVEGPQKVWEFTATAIEMKKAES